ncbi:Cof-type HAD-IIB family hydrolase [Pelomyxa schiedti]|nr:Cof-type HAD-IIB family hydrolase [Pelomyxa schiedti]
MSMLGSARSIRVVVTDVDGTLVPHQKKQPRPAVAAAVARLTASGVCVILASGRSPTALHALHTALGLPLATPVICFNGAAIATFTRPYLDPTPCDIGGGGGGTGTGTGRGSPGATTPAAANCGSDSSWCNVNVHAGMEKLQALLVVSALEECGVKDWVVFCKDCIASPMSTAQDKLDSLWKGYNEPVPVRVKNLLTPPPRLGKRPVVEEEIVCPPCPVKVLAFIRPETDLDETLRTATEPQVAQMRTGVEFLEWLDPQAHKGTGMKLLLNKMFPKLPTTSPTSAAAQTAANCTYDREAVLAIGDGENDICMFGVAGLSVAMGNAPPYVKKLATATTSSCDEDGFAKAMQDHVFGGSSGASSF